MPPGVSRGLLGPPGAPRKRPDGDAVAADVVVTAVAAIAAVAVAVAADVVAAIAAAVTVASECRCASKGMEVVLLLRPQARAALAT